MHVSHRTERHSLGELSRTNPERRWVWGRSHRSSAPGATGQVCSAPATVPGVVCNYWWKLGSSLVGFVTLSINGQKSRDRLNQSVSMCARTDSVTRSRSLRRLGGRARGQHFVSKMRDTSSSKQRSSLRKKSLTCLMVSKKKYSKSVLLQHHFSLAIPFWARVQRMYLLRC